jgi:hypothetical protein
MLMSAPTKTNLRIYQGSNFEQVIRWESNEKGYVNITGISKSAPIIITAPGHLLPAGWRVLVTDVLGMKEINSSDTYHKITVKTVDSVEINNLNSMSFSAYTSGGVLTYNKPVDLTGFTARMQIRASISDSTVLEDLTTENGKIVIDIVNKSITINLSATATAAYTWSAGVYSLEMVSPLGTVTQILVGNVALVKEVTR